MKIMANSTLDSVIGLKKACNDIMKAPTQSAKATSELHKHLKEIPDYLLQTVEPIVLSSLFGLLNPQAPKIQENHKKELIDLLCTLFSKIKIYKIEMFYNMYCYLVFSIYEASTSTIRNNLQEETKLSIIRCISSLFKALSWDVLIEIYKKEHSVKLSLITHVCLEIAEKEQLRSLRIAAMECIMCAAKVESRELDHDVELRKNIADIFMFLFPGLTIKLKNIAVGDFKLGHKIIATALRTWGRLVCLCMEDYSSSDERLSSFEAIKEQIEKLNKENNSGNLNNLQKSLKNAKEIKDYVQRTERTAQWFTEADDKLELIFEQLTKLISHESTTVHQELNDVSMQIFNKCNRNMPKSSIIILEILLTSRGNDLFIEKLPRCFAEYEFCIVLGKLQKRFLKSILALPRVFNGLDEIEQLKLLNSIAGYLLLFQTHRPEYLTLEILSENLLPAFLEICPLQKPDFSILEEVYNKELSNSIEKCTPWSKLCFLNSTIETSYFKILEALSKSALLYHTVDFLINAVRKDEESVATTLFLLSHLLDYIQLSEENNTETLKNLKEIMSVLIELNYSNLTIYITEKTNQKPVDIRNNIVRVCLQMECIGKIACCMKKLFADRFLLLTIFEVLHRAGSSNYLLRTAGLQAANNISEACGHRNISELVRNYPDFFAYHVTRKINKLDCNESVLNVVAAVIKLSNEEILPSISEIIENIITQSCDKFNEYLAPAYLNVFKVFLQYLKKHFGTAEVPRVFKSKKDRENELEAFKVSNLEPEYTDFSDKNVMGNKTAEEMYREDLETLNNPTEEPEIEEVEKPEPPLHVKITVEILKRSLHFLPSKLMDRKLLVLEILQEGVVLLRDFEDNLLPIVHLIWSPLAYRFREEDPVVVNLSFQLLTTLGRLSKDFIRHRTAKEVLPDILTVLNKSSKESYLKDVGSHYRHTQTYKLQLTILTELPNLIMDLDFNLEDNKKAVEVAALYLSDKQPMPLQNLTVQMFKTLLLFDPETFTSILEEIETKHVKNSEYTKNISRVKENV